MICPVLVKNGLKVLALEGAGKIFNFIYRIKIIPTFDKVKPKSLWQNKRKTRTVSIAYRRHVAASFIFSGVMRG
jgi:hypothetical protein